MSRTGRTSPPGEARDHVRGDGGEQATLVLPGLGGDPVGGPVAVREYPLLDPALGQLVVVEDRRLQRQHLAGQLGQEALLDLPVDPLHFALGLGPVWAAESGHGG